MRRQTMEVQMAWLEGELAERAASTPAARRKPPRLPGASKTLPPMPFVPSKTNMPAVAAPPPRRHTMEVEMNWLELVDEKAKAAAASESSIESAKSSGEGSSKKKKKKHKPIPREE